MNLVEEEWIDVSLAMKVTNVFCFSFFSLFPNREKQINIMCFQFCFTFFFLLLTFMPTCPSLVLQIPQNNLLNGMQKLTFAAFFLGCLTHRHLEHAICLSCDPLGLLKPLPLYAPLSAPLFFAGINLFSYFSTPSFSRLEDLTFK